MYRILNWERVNNKHFHIIIDVIFEIKYATCKNSDLNSTTPKFWVHNLCAGFIEGNKVTHIIDPSIGKANPDAAELMSIINATLVGSYTFMSFDISLIFNKLASVLIVLDD